MKYIRRFLNLFRKPIVFDKKYFPLDWTVYDCIKFYETNGYFYIDSSENKSTTISSNNKHHKYKSKSNKNE